MIKKRCAFCRKAIYVDPSKSSVVCPLCHTECGIEPANHCSHGIQLKYIPEKKKCSVCGEIQDIDEFYLHCKSSDNHSTICISCSKKRTHKPYVKKHDDRELPALKGNLGSVLPYLIKVSSRGKYANKILGESLEKIKAELCEA